jgi:putative hydrolase of the HAD superfamily
MHKSKRDPQVFSDVCETLGVRPGDALFVDDNAGHIERASSRGLNTIHFTTVEDFRRAVGGFLRGLP